MFLLLQILYFKGVDKGWLPYHKHGDVLLYALSTGYVLFVAALEPHALRKGYFDFLDDLTEKKYNILFNFTILETGLFLLVIL